jgi:hypothetical protein
MRIPWETIGQTTYDDMVTVLLNHLNPAVQRIDGVGGDGGRDASFATDAGLHVYQLKSFHGRMGKAQRKQVIRSLNRAAELKPARWQLVVPIDPNPSEEKWFEELGNNYPFPIEWKGRTWLDGQFAERPFIAKYFLEDTAQEVLQLLKELARERADLTGGIAEAAERVRALADRINQIDPYYRFDISTDGPKITFTLRTKYVGADRDCPIRGQMRFAIPDTAEGRKVRKLLERNVDFGEPIELEQEFVEMVKLEAPGGIGQLLSDGGPVAVRIGRALPPEPRKLNASFKVRDSGGVTRCEIPVVMVQDSAGRRGSILVNVDQTSGLKVRLELDGSERTAGISIGFDPPRGVLPEALLATVDFLEALSDRHSVLVMHDNDTSADLEWPSDVLERESMTVSDLRVIRALAAIQNVSGIRFLLPARLSVSEQESLAVAYGLVKGPIRGSWDKATIVVTREQAKEILEEQQSKGAIPFQTVEPAILDIAGNVIRLGDRLLSFRSGRAINVEQIAAELAAEAAGADQIAVQLVPGDSQDVEASLLR